ncbi:hypothetical protein niasHT_036875 [Heterodera trifolii]|uniref:Transmembrane protein n=1 Tax=Heterodera trifolii TaxID=157864 RepID=A0ABD2IKH3_9BILA
MSSFLRYLPKFRHRLLFLGGAFASVGVCATAAVLCHQQQNNANCSLLNLSKCAQNYCADRFQMSQFLRRREKPKEKIADQWNNGEEDGGEKMPKNAKVLCRIADQFKKQMEEHKAKEKQRMNGRGIGKQQKIYKESLSKFAFEPICPIISDGTDGKGKEKKETKVTEQKEEKKNEQTEEKQKKSTEDEEKEQNKGQNEGTDKDEKSGERKGRDEQNGTEQQQPKQRRQTDESRNRQMDESKNRQMYESRNRQMDEIRNRQMDEVSNKQTDKSRNRQMDKSRNRQTKERAAVAMVKMNQGLTRETAKGKNEGTKDVEKQRISKIFWTLCYLMEALAGMENGKSSFKLPNKVPTFTELLMNGIRRFWKFLCFLFMKLSLLLCGY